MTNPAGHHWIRDKKRQRIYARDGHCCVWRFAGCRGADDLTLDHVLPRVRGGSNAETNLVTACLSCNSARADRSAIEYAFSTQADPTACLTRMLDATMTPLPASNAMPIGAAA